MTTLDKTICELCECNDKCTHNINCKRHELAIKVRRQYEQNRITHFEQMSEEQAEREMEFVTKFIEDNHRTPTFSDAIEITRTQMFDKACEAFCKYCPIANNYTCPICNRKNEFRKAMEE